MVLFMGRLPLRVLPSLPVLLSRPGVLTLALEWSMLNVHCWHQTQLLEMSAQLHLWTKSYHCSLFYGESIRKCWLGTKALIIHSFLLLLPPAQISIELSSGIWKQMQKNILKLWSMADFRICFLKIIIIWLVEFLRNHPEGARSCGW